MKIKRILALLMAAAMMLTLLAACGAQSPTEADNSDQGAVTDNATGDEADLNLGIEASKSSKLAKSFDKAKNVDYVMIYNPNVYDPYNVTETGVDLNKTASTGSLKEWIDTDVNRAGGLESEVKNGTLSQDQLLAGLPEPTGDEVESDRAGVMLPTFKKGDKRTFAYSDFSSFNPNKKGSFTCAYVGKKCYIWVLDSEKVSKSVVEKAAKEFDSKIYDKDVELYGKPRFADDGAKYSMLLHPMDGGVMGYFGKIELLLEEEFKSLFGNIDPTKYGFNVGIPMLHVCSEMLADKKYQTDVFSTIAHEFQHLINASSSFEIGDFDGMQTWLNESMSGYVEEVMYTGIQKKRYGQYMASENIRYGQSLYNFYNDDDPYVGVYGSVFLFAEYLNKAAGKDVFTKIHKYWRTSFKTAPTTAEALYKNVSSKYQKKIDKSVKFPSSIKFNNKNEEWMSKMTLDFYLSLMKYDKKTDPKCFKNIDAKYLAYDQISGADIEGGGRIIIATKDGKFRIPSDADKDLVYIGFDKKFNQVTEVISK